MKRYCLMVLVIGMSLMTDIAMAAGRGGVSLTVCPYFGSHMVLQREMDVPVWGTAPGGTTITVAFNG